MCYINTPLSIKMIDAEIERLTKRIAELQRRKQFFVSPLPLEPTQPLPDDILPPYGYKPNDWLDNLFPIDKGKRYTLQYENTHEALEERLRIYKQLNQNQDDNNV